MRNVSMTGARTVTGSLSGAVFSLQCDAADVLAYARVHLAPLTSDGGDDPAVRTVLRWHDGQPPGAHAAAAPELARMRRVDRDIYTDGQHLCWFRVDDLRDLYLRFSWMDGRLVVQGDFYHRLGNHRLSDRARRVAQWRQRHALRQRRFTTLLSYLVYYPCWWWLEQSRDRHPVHAAGVVADAGTILLAGGSGVGKSTLAVALATMPGARLLSDSFVLHNGADIFPVREPVLLDAWSRRWIGARGHELQPIDWHYGLNRQGYHLPAQRLADRGRAALVLLPHRAPEPYVRRMSPEEACQRISASGFIINDLRRYWAFAAVLEHMEPRGFVARREEHLARLTAAASCYDLGLTAEMSSAAVVESITELTQQTQAPAMSVRR